MFSIYENNKKISGACHSFVLCLDYVATSPFIYFKAAFTRGRPNVWPAECLATKPSRYTRPA